MTNQQFEEWIIKELVQQTTEADGWKRVPANLTIPDVLKLAHAIRNKVLHEAIEALPKEMDVDKKIELDNIKNFHYNRGIHNSKSSLLNLLTKE